ncbi:MAG: Coq4 family protein [Archangium sp.]
MTAVPRYDLPRAGKALKKLISNPDDLPQVFTLIQSLQGGSMQRIYERFQSTEEGRAMLVSEPDLVPLLSDREALRKMPEGSLAHAYLKFVESEGISAEGIIDAAAKGSKETEDHLTWVRGRMRDTHDLWHAVTGYRGDVLGELSLLAFILAQNFQPGIAAILSAGFMKGLWGEDAWLVVDGYVRGKRAAWLPSVNWEALLPMPLEEVRALLKVGSPREYRAVRSSELREKGVIAAS